MTSSLKLINLAQQAKTTLPTSKLIGHRATYLSRIIGMTEAQKKQKRLSNVDAFKTYTEKILPNIEEVVEIKLLRDRYNELENPLLKNEFLLAYKRRQLTISEMRKAREPFRAPPQVEEYSTYEPVDVYLRNIFEVNDLNIGRVVEFPSVELFKYFPLSPLGEYYPNFFRYTKRFCLQCTEESFKMTNEMRKLNYSRLTEEDYKAVFADAETTKDFRSLLNDEELYPRIFHDFAITFNEKLVHYRKDEIMNKMFTECYIFDFLVNALVRELVCNVMRPHLINQEKRGKIIEQILTQFREKVDPKANAQRPDETLRPFKNFKLTLESEEKGKEKTYLLLLKKYIQTPRYVPQVMREHGFKNFIGFNSGAILSGVRGAGKSGLLMYAVMWAHKNNWIVINAPDAYHLTQDKSKYKRHHDSGLYLEFSKGRTFLRAFKESNYEIIKDLPVNLELYGKYNLAGVHDDEPEPVPVTYDPERKVWSNDWEQFITPNEKLFIAEERRQFNVRLKQRLPEPKTVLEIVEHGLKEEMFSINVIFEILEQVYNLESHKVLVVVDNYNYFFLPTCYPSFRYANNKGYESMVPAHHLALSRAFMKFDGHKIKNGVKLVAPSLRKLYKHSFTPSQINMGKGYTVKLNGLPFDDFKSFTEHLKCVSLWHEGKGKNLSTTEQKFLESQGNYHELLHGILNPNRLYDIA